MIREKQTTAQYVVVLRWGLHESAAAAADGDRGCPADLGGLQQPVVVVVRAVAAAVAFVRVAGSKPDDGVHGNFDKITKKC